MRRPLRVCECDVVGLLESTVCDAHRPTVGGVVVVVVVVTDGVLGASRYHLLR
jgi:hypothetical protein